MIISIIIQYKYTYEDILSTFEVQYDYTLQAVENTIVSPLEQLEIIRNQLVDNLSSRDYMVSPTYVFKNGSYYVDTSHYEVPNSLTGINFRQSDFDALNDEVMSVLTLAPSFRDVIDNTPSVKWIYYTSTKAFLSIYPNLDFESYHVTEETFTYDFFRIVSEEENPERGQKWTKLYNDQVTDELMITISIPVYVEDTYYGALSIDYTLNELTSVLAKQTSDIEGYVIFSDFDEIIAQNENADHILGEDILATDLREGMDADRFLDKGTFLIKTVRIFDQPIFLTTLLSRSDLFYYVLKQLYPILFLVVLAFFIVNLYYRTLTINQQLESSEKQFKTLFNQSLQVIIIVDKSGRIMDINRFGLNFMMLKREDIDNYVYWSLPIWEDHEKTKNRFFKQLKTVEENGQCQRECELVHHSGIKKNVLYTLVPLNEVDEELETLVAIGIDVTEQKDLQYQLENISKTDNLTLALNRRGIMTAAEHNVDRANRSDYQFSILLIDIDYFKNVNDTYGHECGDEILVFLVNLMEKHFKPYDHIGRWGGEEFLVILENTDLNHAYETAESLRKTIGTQPFRCSEIEEPLFINVTIGISVYHDELEFKELVAQADEALYKGKRSGRNQTIIYGESNA